VIVSDIEIKESGQQACSLTAQSLQDATSNSVGRDPVATNSRPIIIPGDIAVTTEIQRTMAVAVSKHRDLLRRLAD
jgi:hypothetical protein